MIKPRFSETYFFSTSLQTIKTGTRISGFELWIDEQLVIGEGKSQGQMQLSKDQWSSVTIHYRVTTNSSPQVPQLIVQWQSAS